MESGAARITVESGFPWNGKVNIQVACESTETFTLALRIPGWCRQYEIAGIEDAQTKEKDGYLYLTRAWKMDSLQIEFPMEVQVMAADPGVREDIGKAAVMRGPIVYCLEEADNGKNLHLLKMDENAPFETVQKEISTESVIAVRAQGWRQKTTRNTALYAPYTKAEYERTTLTWIPYYTWANRGEGEMQVFTEI